MLVDGRLIFAIQGSTNSADAYRSVLDDPELFAGSVVIVPGHTSSSRVDINMLYCCYEYVSYRLSEATAQ